MGERYRAHRVVLLDIADGSLARSVMVANKQLEGTGFSLKADDDREGLRTRIAELEAENARLREAMEHAKAELCVGATGYATRAWDVLDAALNPEEVPPHPDLVDPTEKL